jgi:predicted RNA-binding Zn-ribbon protein involved in translation (DUF1610 family)
MTEEKRKRRSKSKRHQNSFIRDFRVEIFIVFLFLLGAFLLYEDMEIKSVVFSGILSFFNTITNAFSSLLGAILGGLAVIETSDVVGSILIFIAFLLLTYRARQQAIIRYYDLTVCPECGSELNHIHRNRLQRITGTLLRLKIRRYKCKECSFDGLKIRSLNSR